MARRYLRGRNRRFVSGITAIATGGVFVGVAAIIIVLSVENGFHKELRDRIVGSTPHVVVSRYGYEPVPYEGEDDPTVTAIRRVPGVVDVAPFIYLKTLVRSGRAVEGALVSGVLPDREAGMTAIAECLVDGEFSFDSSGVVLGKDLARTLGVEVGDRLTLASPFGGTSTPVGPVPRARTFRVNGIFDSGMYEVDAGVIYAGLADMQRFLNMAGQVSGYEVKVREVDAAMAVSRRIARELGFPYRAMDWITKNRNLFAALRLEKVVTFIVLVLIVLVAAFNIVGMLTMMVMRKTREIGILKTIGAGPGVITRTFIAAGLLIGLVGTSAGALFGFVASWLLNKYRFVSLPGDVYFIRNLPVHMQAMDFVIVCGAAVVITFLATIYPALRAARLQPVEAIRYE